MIHRFPLLIVVAWSTLPHNIFGQDAPSVDSITTGMEEYQNRWISQPNWLVEYTHNREYHNIPADRTKAYSERHFIYARRGEDTFIYEREGDGREKGDETWTLWVDNICETRTGDALMILPEPSSHIFEKTFYTNALFVDIYDAYTFRSADWKRMYGAASPSKAFWMGLPAGIKDHQQDFRIKDQQEEIDGDKCYVLERPGRDTIWVDLQHGYIVRKRVYRQQSGNTLFEQLNTDLQEVADGFWIPKLEVQHRYNLDGAYKGLDGKLASIETNKLIRAEFGTVPEEQFTIPLNDEMLVTDKVRGKRYIKYPENMNAQAVFEAGIERAMREAIVPMERLHSRTNFAAWLVFGNILVILIGVLVYQFVLSRR